LLTLGPYFGNSTFGVPVSFPGLNYSFVPSFFYSDRISPSLVSFDVDLNQSSLTLYFSEVVRVNSFSTSKSMVLSSSAGLYGLSYIVGFGFVDSQVSCSDSIRVVLSWLDVQNISQLPGLLRSQSSSFVKLVSGAIADMNGNLYSSPDAVPASSFVSDFTSPALSRFSVDFDKGILSLFFNKAINASTFVPGHLLAQAGPLSSYPSLPLLGCEFSTAYYIVYLNLNMAIINKLKSLSVFTSREQSYLCTSGPLVADTYGNAMPTIPCNEALDAISYGADVTRPNLTRFDISMNETNTIVTIYINEPFNTSTLEFSGILLTSLQNSSANFVNISVGNVTSYDDSGPITTAQFFLSESDTDRLKLQYICLVQSSCYLSIQNVFFKDLAGNEVTAAVLPVTGFIGDAIPPVLLEFELDMNLGYLVLSFSEPVNSLSLNSTLLELENAP